MINFFKNKKIFITGHTGFKGTWLTRILIKSGAEVFGYSLKPDEKNILYKISDNEKNIKSFYGDVRDFENLKNEFIKFQPEFVIHMAAQPLVRDSYESPKYTYETNFNGTLNLLECCRICNSVKSILNVTTDKVYFNKELDYAYKEDDKLDGYDPYSNSKSCSELITNTYRKSFFNSLKIPISTARAGNVIGGGDFSKDRILPDAIRSIIQNEDIFVRNPNSIRPYQHVLEPLYAYLIILYKQHEDITLQGSYNVGPRKEDCIKNSELMNTFCNLWDGNIKWLTKNKGGPHESNFLKLDIKKIQMKLNFSPLWNYKKAIKKTIEYYKVYLNKGDTKKVMDSQILEYFEETKSIVKW